MNKTNIKKKLKKKIIIPKLVTKKRLSPIKNHKEQYIVQKALLKDSLFTDKYSAKKIKTVLSNKKLKSLS